MRFAWLFWMLPLAFLGLVGNAAGREIVLPAGTLLQCTLDEPNFSSATAEVGDPVLCHPRAVQQFGQSVFPRGTYLVGHLEAEKDPGHFVGKGYLKLQFDRIGLPNTDLPLPGKVISVRGFRVDREGKIIGHGHPTRDTVEWMIPPLWPWKIIKLPSRGPKPALKGEVTVTMRLMDDVAVPQTVASPWRRFGAPDNDAYNPPRSFLRPSAAMPGPAGSRPEYGTAVNQQSADPASEVSSQSAAEGIAPAATPTLHYASLPKAQPVSGLDSTPSKVTLFALKSGTVFAFTDYWVDRNSLGYVLSNGDRGSLELSEVDWDATTQLNSGRGVRVSLRRESATAIQNAAVPVEQ